MKFFVVFTVALACVFAEEEPVPIVKSSYDITPEGAFRYLYETGNGIYAEAAGEVKNPNTQDAFLSVQGGYKYTAPDGTPVEVVYTADNEGFKPQGSHIPVAPEIPEAILRSLAYIAAHPPPVEATNKPDAKPNFS